MKTLGFYSALCVLLVCASARADDPPTLINLETDAHALWRAEQRIEPVDEADWGKHITIDGAPNAMDKKGATLLHHAAENGRLRLCRLLISRGWNVNAPNGEGKTPPMIYRGKDMALWNTFFEAGIDVRHTDGQGNTLLHRRDDTPPEVFRRLIAAGADVNTMNQEGMTPLGVMASWNYASPELVTLLLDAGADVNLHKKRSPLAAALERESSIIAHVLLDAGADVNDNSVRGYVPLYRAGTLWDMDLIDKMLARADDDKVDSMRSSFMSAAISCGNIELCALMIEQGVDVNEGNTTGVKPFLKSAIQSNQIETVRFLLEQGVEVEQAPPIGEPHQTNFRVSPLAAAVSTGNVEMARLLVRHGARFFNDEYDSRPLLHDAVYTGSVEMCRYVANFNSDMNVRGRKGETALHLAVERLNYELCVFLLSRGAAVNAQNEEGRTPLHLLGLRDIQPYGEYRAGLRVAKLLLDAGADIRLTDKRGRDVMHTLLDAKWQSTRFISKQMQLHTRRFRNDQTPDELLLAAYDGDVERFKRLVADGKDPAMKDDYNESAIHFAVRGGKPEMVKHLLATGVNPDTRGLYDATPLHYAAALGHPEIIELLVDAGADINAKDEFYEAPPLMWALGDWQGECVKTLVRRGADINANNRNNCNAFALALLDRKYTYCDFFVQSGYDLNEALKIKSMSSLFNDIPMTRRVLEDLKRYGLDFTIRGPGGSTLLHYILNDNFFSYRENADIRYLLENGGMECVTMKNSQGMTPLDSWSPSGNESLRNKARYILRQMEKE